MKNDESYYLVRLCKLKWTLSGWDEAGDDIRAEERETMADALATFGELAAALPALFATKAANRGGGALSLFGQGYGACIERWDEDGLDELVCWARYTPSCADLGMGYACMLEAVYPDGSRSLVSRAEYTGGGKVRMAGEGEL